MVLTRSFTSDSLSRYVEKPFTMASPQNAVSSRRSRVFVAVLEDQELTDENLHFGTLGYVLPGDDQAGLMRALEDLRNGRRPPANARRVHVKLCPPCSDGKGHRLSPRELDVLRALVEGLSNKMIAAELRISFETVRSHMKCIYQKMQVNNNTAAVAKALQEGVLLPETAA
jgi:DNA-binding NarL/FixJ family response regulator